MVLNKPPETMMVRVGAYEAKTRFSELLTQAEGGAEIEITRNGRIVARLVPAEAKRRLLAREIVARWKAEPAADTASDVEWRTLKSWMNKGRPGCD